MTQIRWLHISDFHLGKDVSGCELQIDRLLDLIRSKTRPDLIFISGDIANKGEAIEYDRFIEKLVFPLIDIYETEDLKDKVFIVPGNHDVQRNISRLIDTYSLHQTQPHLFDNTKEAFEIRKDLAARFCEFATAFRDLCHVEYLTNNNVTFKKELKINDIGVNIVLLNTSWFCQSDQDFEHLSTGYTSLETNLKSISPKSPQFTFVVGHHPTDWLRPSEKEKINNLLAKYGCIYLHGHKHQATIDLKSVGAQRYINFSTGVCFE